MTTRHAYPHTFVIERDFAFPVETVYHGFSDPAARAAWFVGPAGWTCEREDSEFVVGGRDYVKSGPPGSHRHIYDARYIDIAPNERIIIAFTMSLDETLITASLQTVEFAPKADGSRLTLTEQIVFLPGFEELEGRTAGTRGMLEQFDAYLKGL